MPSSKEQEISTASEQSTIVVVGGASGIGRACAEHCASLGQRVVIWDIAGELAQTLASDLSQRYSLPCVGLGVDVADLQQIKDAVQLSRPAQGGIDGLVYAAGIAGAVPLAQLTPENWAQVMDINLRGFVFSVKALLGDLKHSDRASIVAISSINAALGNAANPAYSASKGGILSLVRALADDLATDGIRINSVSPGQINTPMLNKALDAVEGLQDHFKRRILLRRLGQPEEVAQAVSYLLSPQASYVTASEMVVDGGNISSQR